MLVITRRPSESVRIGKDVVVVVLGVKGNQVRVGIEAPKEISIVRDDVKKPRREKRG